MTMKQIFISYSRRDTDFARKLTTQLEQAGFSVWLDTDDLVPGTPNWEQGIRTAIEKAGAVLLIASPDSRQSVYVQGELTLAQLRQCPVYPVWANGNDWIESIPLGMVNYQYIDCRGKNYDIGVQEIIKTMKTVVDTSEGMITLSVASHERIQLNIRQFETGLDILNHIYLNYLQYWYQPFTYGIDWILGNIETKQLAIPWEWLEIDREDSRQTATFPIWYLQWGGLSPSSLDIQDKSIWAVWEIQRLRIGGIAVNNRLLHQKILSKYGERELRLQIDDGCLKQTTLDQVNDDDYQYKTVIALMSLYKQQSIFIEQPENCE